MNNIFVVGNGNFKHVLKICVVCFYVAPEFQTVLENKYNRGL